MKSSILGPDGLPFDRTSLLIEQSAPSLTSVRQIHSGHPADGLTPARLAGLLRSAETGNARAYLELAEQMEEKDLHYLGVLGKRKRAVTQLEISVADAKGVPNAKAAGDLIRQFIDRDELQIEMFDMLDAIGKGYSVTEILWDTSGGQWMPTQLKYRDPRWFHYNNIDGETLETWTNEGPVPVQPYKYIHHKVAAKSGLPIRGGLARAISWLWMFKNFDVKAWTVFAETYGQPIRIGKYDGSASAEDKAVLLKALRNIGSDMAGIIPVTMQMELIEAKMTGNIDLFERYADWIDRQVSKAVLGNTGTTDAIAGGHAVGKVHRQVEEDIERADAKLLSATLNRDLVKPLIDLNFGPQEQYPRLRIVVEDEQDGVQMANAVSLLVDAGLEVAQDDMRQRLGLRRPEPGEAILKKVQNASGQLPVPTPSVKSASRTSAPDLTVASQSPASQSPATAETDSIDMLIAEQLSQWEPVMAPMIDPIQKLADECKTPEEFTARLAEVLGQMDPTKLADMLAKVMFGSRLAGVLGVDDGGH